MMHESCKKSLTFTTLKLTNMFCKKKKLTNTCYTRQREGARARERERKEREESEDGVDRVRQRCGYANR
jgi:hypothetical protein